MLLAIQVETWVAVEHLDDLLAVEGVDLLSVGPTDLASSMGLDHPTGRRCARPSPRPRPPRAAGRRTGIFAFGPDDAAAWLEAGGTWC